MAQLTWRGSEELLARVRSAAQRDGRSMNEYVSLVLDAATDPDLGGTAAERVRDRLASAGLLAPAGAPRRRPPKAALEAARRAASHGSRLSDLVVEGRQ